MWPCSFEDCEIMIRKKNNKINFYIGSTLIGIIGLMVLVGLFYTPYDPDAMNGALMNQPPSLQHPFGCDYFGRDILSRVMVGTKTTFIIAILTVFIGGGIGTILGAFTGYFGGVFDEIFMRINDGLASFPSILLALILVSVFGKGKYYITIALAIVFIPSFARVMRSEFLKQRSLDYVSNARLMGAGHLRIMFLHILPNTKAILVSTIVIAFNNAVLAEAGMSYLGLGVQPPDASLGRMLSEAQGYLFSAPWFAIAPGLVIILAVLGFNLINEG